MGDPRPSVVDPSAHLGAGITHHRYAVLGFAFDVRCDQQEIAELIHSLLEPFDRSATEAVVPTYGLARKRGSGPAAFVATVDGRQVKEAPTPEGLVDVLLWTVFRRAIDRYADGVAVHAGAVSIVGKGLVLPAPMDAGKTTLVAGLVREGFGYLSDEAALLEIGTGSLLPYHKPLTLDPGARRALFGDLTTRLGPRTMLRQHLRADELRDGSTAGPCQVRFVVAPRYERGARTVLEPIGRGTALMELCANAFNLDRVPKGIETLARVVRSADCYRLLTGDLSEAVRQLVVLSTPSASSSR